MAPTWAVPGLFPVGETVVFEFHGPSVIFWPCKIEILTIVSFCIFKKHLVF